MKKLLVLALVLGMVGMATAGLSFKVNGDAVADGGNTELAVGTLVTVDIVNDAPVVGPIDIGWIGVTAASTSAWGPGAIGGQQIGTWSIVLYGEDAGAEYWRTVLVAPPAGGASTPAGTLFTVTFTLDDTAAFEVWNDSFDALGAACTIAVPTIPEPMTMLLLGLGGLFLRKK